MKTSNSQFVTTFRAQGHTVAAPLQAIITVIVVVIFNQHQQAFKRNCQHEKELKTQTNYLLYFWMVLCVYIPKHQQHRMPLHPLALILSMFPKLPA